MRRKDKRPTLPDPPPDVGIPPELREPDAAVWHDQHAYHRYMRQRGWTMPPRERLNVETDPPSRRRSAVTGWARATGITTTVTYGANTQHHPDWPQLRTWGLCS